MHDWDNRGYTEYHGFYCTTCFNNYIQGKPVWWVLFICVCTQVLLCSWQWHTCRLGVVLRSLNQFIVNLFAREICSILYINRSQQLNSSVSTVCAHTRVITLRVPLVHHHCPLSPVSHWQIKLLLPYQIHQAYGNIHLITLALRKSQAHWWNMQKIKEKEGPWLGWHDRP